MSKICSTSKLKKRENREMIINIQPLNQIGQWA